MSEAGTSGTGIEIAVVGMAGRFPGASGVEEFWRNLSGGVESVRFFTDEELKAKGVDAALVADPDYVRAEAVLDEVELFDASFFGYTPREAALMDPQHRLFLEHAWEALERAGYCAEKYDGRIGVYAGESVNSYLLSNLYPNRELLRSAGAFQTIIGNDRDYLATHVSYKLNLKGAALSVQTACSTSLVAVHLACQSLLNQECDMALAGGVSVSVPQGQGALHQEGGIISPDGHCRAFDARARGTVKGSGVGVVVLKRLEDALAEGDPVHAVILGSAINNDGSAKVGYTAPSVNGQAAVIEEALSVAGVEPETISYVEAHGTGTALGDPIEIAALTQAFSTASGRKNFCAVGSVKTNIGHLDAAAGVTGLIKTVLALKHRKLPPSLNFEQPNPNIDFEGSPFYVNTKLSEWNRNGTPRRAGVSSFGIGGTNAHVVLEEAPAVNRTVEETSRRRSRPLQLLTLSAKTETALEAAAARLSLHLRQQPAPDLTDVAFTLRQGRRDFDRRLAVVCRDALEAVEALESADARRLHRDTREGGVARPVVFMFTGQGSQYAGMARGLYETEEIFRATVDECSELLRAHLGFDLRDVLFPPAERAEEASERLKQTEVTQPALFVVEYALARLWTSWGVRPQALIGHSIGEYVAACLAGVFSLEDALRLVAVRGRLMQSAPVGAMLAVPLAEAEVKSMLGDDLSLAAVNALSLVVVSGTVEAVERLERELEGRGLVCRRLHTSHALHSRLMEAVLPQFAESFRDVTLRAPQIPIVSTMTGRWMTGAEATNAEYWTRQVREPVRFADAVGELLREPENLLLEVGPGQTLSSLAKLHREAMPGRTILSSLPAHGDAQGDVAYLLGTLARMWTAGVEIDWRAFDAGEGARRRVELPTYPFERERFWIDPPASSQTGASEASSLTRKGEVADYFYVPSWTRVPAPETDALETLKEDACWLVFNDPGGLGARLMSRLERRGEFVVSVMLGEQFDKLGERTFVLNPHQRGGYEALMKELRALGKTPARVLHLWGVTPEAAAVPSNFDWYGESLARGFYSLLYLAQTFGEHGLSDETQIVVVTNHMQEVTGEEPVRPEKATVLGACKVITQEYPALVCRSIDIHLPPTGSASEELLLENLLGEFAAPVSESVVAYRGRRRWTQGFEPARLGVALEESSPPRLLRERGVYLLTGNLGDLDLALARYLAGAAHARLVMLTDENFPARDSWNDWLASHDADEETTRRIRELLSLEESGAEVLALQADVSKREEMERALAVVRERFGEVNGVVHTASATSGGMVQLKTKEMAERILAPKVQGALVLQSLLEDAPLDFFLVSSTSLALTGVFGQSDYCAANCFLDAFAHANTAARPKTLTASIDWHIPQWERWQESLMAAVPELQAQFAETRQLYGVRLEEGVEAFRRILSSLEPQVVVSTVDFQAFIREQQKNAGANLFDQLETSAPARLAHARDDSDADYVAPADETEKAIAAIWEELFGLQRIGANDNFFELGGNSLLAIQLVSRVRRDFQIELPLTSLFEAPTTAGLAAAVNQNLVRDKESEEIERLLREIESLSPDELEATLAEELQASDENADG
ncbi:MAG TPA: SDR family NAD(P)-dependent oxidoreductase [Pyrinomonadaceae bacterium]|jgi:acyl transferase domain-containing protein/acyl carrier protein